MLVLVWVCGNKTKNGCNFQKWNQNQILYSTKNWNWLLELELEVIHKSKKPFNIGKNLLFAILNLIQFRHDVLKQILWIPIWMFK